VEELRVDADGPDLFRIMAIQDLAIGAVLVFVFPRASSWRRLDGEKIPTYA
jgi:hypothetical protein